MSVDYIVEFIWFVLPSILFCFFVSFVYYWISFFCSVDGSSDRVRVLPLTSFGFLGWIVGYFVGMSSSPVIGDFVPAFLGLFGLVGAFKIQNKDLNFYSILVLFLSLNTLMGAQFGARTLQNGLALNNSLVEQRVKIEECAAKMLRAKKLSEELGINFELKDCNPI